MNLLLLAAAAVAAVNAPRAWAALPGRGRSQVAVLGAVAALGALAMLAASAGPIADALDLTPPTVRMGAGAVAALQGLASMLLRPPRPEPSLGGRAASLVPVAFPVLLTPALGVLAISGALDRSAPVTIGVLAGALGTVPLAAVFGPEPGPVGGRTGRGLGAALGAVLVLAGLGLVWNGTFDL